MNKLIFSEGGQPVCLDDLKTLQENSFSSMNTLMEALGCGTHAFLLNNIDVQNAHFTTDEKTGFTLKSGTLVVGGEFFSWEDTELAISDGNTPIYLCIKETDCDLRTFEDGQIRNCLVKKEIYASLDKTGSTMAYNIYELKTLFDLLKSKLNLTVDRNWKDLKVTLKNGYTGTVQYQELEYSYRFRFNLKSTATSWDDGDGVLFMYDPQEWIVDEFVSPEFMTGGDDMYAVKVTKILVYGERAILDGEKMDFSDTIYDPMSCSVNTIVDIPKVK